MRDLRLSAFLPIVAGLTLAGCASTPSESGTEPAAESNTTAAEPDRKSESARTEKIAEKPAASSSREVSRESYREPAREPERAPASTASTSRSETREEGANSPARLVAQLNDATREIAVLRAANAKLKAGLPASAPAASTSVRGSDPLDEKLAGKVKSYASFKQELAGVFAENDKLRAENAALATQLKESSSGSKEVKAAIAKLESDLRAEKSAAVKLETELKTEKSARAQAEQSATKLREQLRVVASAVSGVDTTTAPEPRTRGTSAASRRHLIKDGETLEKLADRYYGDPTKWRVILEANRGRLPLDGALPPGLELEIPGK